MSKANSGLFHNTSGDKANKSVAQNEGPVNGSDFNTAGSNSVGKVDTVTTTHDVHNVPDHGIPNSVSKNYKKGKLNSERYYDSNGDAYLDIDYTDHGNSKMHPNVPHEHSIHFDQDGTMHRDDEPKGGLNK